MKPKIFHIVILIIISSILHLTGIFGGLYEKGVEIDAPQHVLGGIIFSLVWLRILKVDMQFRASILFLSTLSFAAFISVMWEILEFAVWKLLPAFANTFKFYSPTVTDLLGDISNGLIGGLFVSIFAVRKYKQFFRNNT